VFRVTRRYRFAASHRLHSDQLTEEENWRVYGKCNNPYGHGHNYVLQVSARGPLGPAGIALDKQRLDELVARHVLDLMDHRNLNCDVEWAEPVTPTSENLAIEICRRLQRQWQTFFPGEWPKLDRVRIEETPRNIFEVGADEVQ
jgi:6-pyruvoyltetrahydropterin/6-carboxytetrahydropterin synthase